MANTSEHIKKQLIEALQKSLGVVSTACKVVGISRTTYYQYLKDDEDFKSQVENIEEEAIDFVESKLFEQIQDNNTTATIFYLKTNINGKLGTHRVFNLCIRQKSEGLRLRIMGLFYDYSHNSYHYMNK